MQLIVADQSKTRAGYGSLLSLFPPRQARTDSQQALPFQIDLATNTVSLVRSLRHLQLSSTIQAKAVIPRIAGTEVPKLEDGSNTTFALLYERIDKTVEVLKGAKREDFVDKENNEVSIMNGKYTFTALEYMQNFGLPK